MLTLKDNNPLTQERLKEYLKYNRDTGIFIWRVGRGGVHVNHPAGTKDKNGYIVIRIDGTGYKAHRLAFLYIEGRFPNKQVDHINRIRHDNKWENLRHSTIRENSENKINNNNFIGVCWRKSDRCWQAYSSLSEEEGRVFIGRYKTHLAACYARWANDVQR